MEEAQGGVAGVESFMFFVLHGIEVVFERMSVNGVALKQLTCLEGVYVLSSGERVVRPLVPPYEVVKWHGRFASALWFLQFKSSADMRACAWVCERCERSFPCYPQLSLSGVCRCSTDDPAHVRQVVETLEQCTSASTTKLAMGGKRWHADFQPPAVHEFRTKAAEARKTVTGAWDALATV